MEGWGGWEAARWRRGRGYHSWNQGPLAPLLPEEGPGFRQLGTLQAALPKPSPSGHPGGELPLRDPRGNAEPEPWEGWFHPQGRGKLEGRQGHEAWISRLARPAPSYQEIRLDAGLCRDPHSLSHGGPGGNAPAPPCERRRLRIGAAGPGRGGRDGRGGGKGRGGQASAPHGARSLPARLGGLTLRGHTVALPLRPPDAPGAPGRPARPCLGVGSASPAPAGP